MTLSESVQREAASIEYLVSRGNNVPPEVLEHRRICLAALREMEERTTPKPLSIDDLRQMIGQPVWVTHRDGSGGRWGIVNEYSGSLCADVESGQAYWFDDYIGTVAYRHRPPTQEAAP